MSLNYDASSLPDSKSSDLYLSHPTDEECMSIWAAISDSWRDHLSIPLYLQESLFLTTVPLAKDGGMTTWILVDKLALNDRKILCSCESFRKRSLVSDEDGNVSDTIVHGIASVFCPPAYRGRGYASRFMEELAKALRTWQVEEGDVKCIGSILYSDIGKSFYANVGWQPTPSNTHFVFQLSNITDLVTKPVLEQDLFELCRKDEAMIRMDMANPAKGTKRRVAIVPDLDHMLWHIRKEDFACNQLFGKVPNAKGAIAGPVGRRVWAIWTHRYYSNPADKKADNTLYILRLVVENQELGRIYSNNKHKSSTSIPSEQIEYLRTVLAAAQSEALEWKLDQVDMWHPTPVVRDMIDQSGVLYSVAEREEDSIASGLWFDEKDVASAPEWIHNEHYAWC